MPKAKNAEVARLVSVKEWCAECTCLEDHVAEPDFIQVAGSNPDKMSTKLLITSRDSESVEPRVKEVEVAGIHRETDVVVAIRACEGLVFDDEDLVCGWIAILTERGIHGRKEVLTR